MSRTILMAWELGSDIAHLSQFAELAAAFKAQGHRVVIALRDLSRAHFFFRKLQVPVIQAPVWLYPVQMERPVFCMADILMTKGYLFHTTLQNQVEAWQHVLDLVQPDLVVSEYAPTLRLALRGTGTPDVVLGTGFAEPVSGAPMTDLRPVPKADGIVPRQEKRLLETINEVLGALDKPRLERFSELYQPAQLVLKTLPELDVGGPRDDVYYCLPRSRSRRAGAEWVAAPGKKVFVYGLPDHPQWARLLAVLTSCGANVYLYSPGDRRQRLKAYDDGAFRLGTDIINVVSSLEQADLFICHGEMNNLVSAACVGVPVLVLPMNLEQLLNGLAYQRLGAGACLQQMSSESAGVQAIQRLLQPEFAEAARELAQRASQFDQEAAVEQIAERCLSLLP